MQRRCLIITSALAVAVWAAACSEKSDSSSNELTAQPTPLMDGFTSRQKASDVEGALIRLGLGITVLEDGANSASRSKWRPPLAIRIVNVSSFSYLGLPGQLRLEFVDDELAATWFYPRDPALFDAEMRKRGLALESVRPIRLHTATELRMAVDYLGAKYWAWEDAHLRQKVEKWIKKNA
jgi:hypothetical protein